MPWRTRPMVAGVLLIVAAVIVIGASIAGSYFLTIGVATRTATQIERARTAALAAQQQGEIAGALRECRALQGLAEVRGSHSPAATYGERLQAGIANVYTQSGCPVLLKKYGSRS
jgi:hypothetical protein